MTTAEAVQHLANIARKKERAYHPSYAWTVDYSRRLKAHFAGVGIDDYLEQFARRESRELFEQRKRVTKHIQKSLGHALDRPFSKVSRANYVKVLAFEGDDAGDRAKQFDREVLQRFTRRGLDHWTFERVRYWSAYDPNCFLVVEFDTTDGTQRARPYPFEVTAEMAVDFSYTVHGELEYLVCRQAEQTGDFPIPGQEIERLTLYQPLQTVVLQQLKKEQIAQTAIPAAVDTLPDNPMDGDLIRIGSHAYRIEVPPPHRKEETPARRVGYMPNPEDDGFTRLSIFDAALPFAEKVVKGNSELDIVMAFLAFPVSVRYEEPCEAAGCDMGHLADGSSCTMCRGTGYKPRPTSAQEEILLPMPRNPEDMVDLTKVIQYTYPPTDSIDLQFNALKHYFQEAKQAVFNSEMFTRAETTQTATFHGIALQSVYDTLYPYAENLGAVWSFIADACRVFTGFAGQMTAGLVFPKNFRFETTADLFAELKQAREAEAGTDTTALLEERIMGSLLVDDRERWTRWQVENAFNPFRGMTEAQVLTALQSSIVPEWKKVFWVNRVDILAEIVETQPDFYRLAPRLQRQIIRQAVEALQAEIQASAPALNLGDISQQVEEPDRLGKVPLALQHLALARQRAFDSGDQQLAGRIGEKIDELLEQV